MSQELLDQLSDQDLQALLDKNLDGLSDQGLTFLSSLPEDQFSQLFQEEDMEEMEEMEEPEAEVPPITEPTTMEAISTGMVQGVPFLKDGIAGVEAIVEQVQSDEPFTIDELTSKYRHNLEDINRAVAEAEQASPYLTGAGELVSSAALFPTTGLRSALALGAASAVSRSEDRGVEDALVGAAMGATGHGVGTLVGKMFKGATEKVGGVIGKTREEAIMSAFGGDKAYAIAKLDKHLRRTGQTREEFIQMVDKFDLISPGDHAIKLRPKVDNAIERVGKSIEEVYKRADEAIGGPSIDFTNVKEAIHKNVADKFLRSDDPSTKAVGEQIKSYVNQMNKKVANAKRMTKNSGIVGPDGAPVMVEEIVEEVIEDTTPWTITRLHQLNSDIYAMAKNAFKSSDLSDANKAVQLKQIAGELRQSVQGALDNVPSVEGTLKEEIRQLNRAYGGLNVMSDINDNALKSQSASTVSKLKNVFNFKNLALVGAGYRFGGPMGATAGAAIGIAISSPTTSSYLVKGLPALQAVIANNPTGKIMQKLTAASFLNHDQFEEQLHSAVAEVNLRASPIPRDSRGVMEKQDHIKQYLRVNKPSLLNEFQDLIDEGNDDGMGVFMDTLSKIPEVSHLFDEGIGFNGKVYTDEDKQMLENQLKNEDMSSVDRMRLLRELRNSGTIPDMESITPREPKKYVPRDKTQYRY